ncbi:hypothetical protein SFRURICE_007043 [Spodoptera frugiperda]|nr:hypothetical protein SFRURICE_007043 [Spodoptera frugiperda]
MTRTPAPPNSTMLQGIERSNARATANETFETSAEGCGVVAGVLLCGGVSVHGAMISGGWVCALHVRTAGLGGAALGSDEEEIVYLAYVVIDVLTNQFYED